jgi:hypothetical protein
LIKLIGNNKSKFLIKNMKKYLVLSLLIVLGFYSVNALASTTIGTDISSDGTLGIGSGATGAQANILSLTEQLRLLYSTSSYVSFIIDSANSLNITPQGSAGGWKIIGDSISPILISGYSGNSVSGASHAGSAILSGGSSGSENLIINEAGSVIGGGGKNKLDSTSPYAGSSNIIGGGFSNSIIGGGWYTAILGGTLNAVTSSVAGHAPYLDFIGGGNNNIIDSHHNGSNVIVGGELNKIYGNGNATIAGGQSNTSWHYGFVGGGFGNIAGASGKNYSTVAGGQSNAATGYIATIPGGINNTASGDYSFAAGRRASSTHQGAFVWADSNDKNFLSTTTNEFALRAIGGVRMVTAIDANGGPTKTVTLSSSGNLSVSGSVNATGTISIASPIVPSASTSTCTAGTITWDSGYVYVCVSDNLWKRATLDSW